VYVPCARRIGVKLPPGAMHQRRGLTAGRKRRTRAEEKALTGDLDHLLPILSIILRMYAGRKG